MSRKKQRIATDGGERLSQNPFGALDGLGGLPDGPKEPAKENPPVEKTSKRGQKNTNRGRVDIIRQTAHRGGKAVTVVTNFPPIEAGEKKELLKKMQKTCGVGGAIKGGNIEIQGDKRDQVKQVLIDAGFKPVFAGG